jgi:phenylalanyl-tRNA synthetase beta chain
MKIVHDWLKEYLGNGTPSVEEVERLLTLFSFEIDGRESVAGHDVLDVKILPNRSADCLSHRGVARELAAITSTPLAYDPLKELSPLPKTDQLSITVDTPEACPHFSLALMTDIVVGPSPEWLVHRLEAAGQRSINNIVDATNYVMFSLGQPLHAYDADKFSTSEAGQWDFLVRMAVPGESITVLTGETYELTETVQLIVNGATNTPASIAGIKGGAYAIVDASTTNIILEAGNFAPSLTRRASQQLRLTTDASKRFENGVPAGVAPYALSEVVELIKKIANGTLVGAATVSTETVRPKEVLVSTKRANALLGMQLSSEKIAHILNDLDCAAIQDNDVFMVTPPWWRTDLTIEADVIEEVGRIAGYDTVTTIIPDVLPVAEINPRHYYSEQIRDYLIAQGFSEVITSSFRSKDEIQLQNSLAADKSYLRSSLAVNLNEVLAKNAPFMDLLGVRLIMVFEIGTVFTKSEHGVSEHFSLAVGVRHKVSGHTPKDDTLVQEHISALQEVTGLQFSLSTVKQGVIECNLTTAIKAAPVPTRYASYQAKPAVQYRPFSLFPAITRDIALWVSDETRPADVFMLINEHAGALRVRTTLFDTFSKEGKTSFAFRLVFQAPDRTLTDAEVNDEMAAVYLALSKQGWEIR